MMMSDGWVSGCVVGDRSCSDRSDDDSDDSDDSDRW